jgi:hypothetical protein
MTDAATKPTRVETCRWSLGLGLALLVASLAGAAAAVPRLAPHSQVPESPGSARAEGSPCLLAPEPAAPARLAPGDLRPGLLAEYFPLAGRHADFPDLAPHLAPAITRVDRQIRFERADGGFGETPLRDGLYVRWTGLVRIPREGRYRFFTSSDDGSRLFIDDQPVVDNGGVHGMREAAGEAALQAGDHELRLEFFSDAGRAGCSLSWEADGLAKDVVPEGALFHREGRAGPGR